MTQSNVAFLPFVKPEIDEETIQGVADVLRSGWITTGPQNQAFEAALSEFCGGRPVRTFNSGTATLEIGLRIAGVGSGDEVITTPASWVATSNVIYEVGVAWLLLATIAGTGHDVFGTLSSGAPLAPAVRAAIAKLPPDTPFYSVGVLDHTLPFYVRHSMTMVAVTDELKFGIEEEPQKWIPTVDEWKERWKASRYALALLPAQRYDELAAQGLPMQVIARDARRVVVERPPQP